MAEESRAPRIERAIREVAGLDVVVEDADGAITLEGMVDSERDRQAAEDMAVDLAGDTDIGNVSSAYANMNQSWLPSISRPVTYYWKK